jgi:arylsulfatase A-like enzyme
MLTIVNVLRSVGYETMSCCGFPMPYFALRGWYDRHRVSGHADARWIADTYEKWRNGRDRTFAYLHFADLHEPLAPPAEHVEDRNVDTNTPGVDTWDYVSTFDGGNKAERYREHRLRLYGAAFDYVERVMEDLVQEYGDSTLLIVTGDHGEGHWEQWEHGRLFTDSRGALGAGHGGTPFDMTARVPLGVSAPDGKLEQPGPGWPSLVDVPPTILRAVCDDDGFDGYPWQDPVPENRAVLCEASRYGVERKAIYRDETKVIRSEADDVWLVGTVDESRNEEDLHRLEPSESPPGLADFLPDDWRTERGSHDVGQLATEQLEALGYK